jgi:hypothetical protein
MEPEGSLPSSLQPATGPQSWAGWIHSSYFLRPALILSPSLRLGLPSGSFIQGSPSKSFIHFYLSHAYHMRHSYDT